MFEQGHAPLPGSGRPAGSQTTVAVPKSVQRQVIRSLTQRVKQDDPEALGLMVQLMCAGYGSKGVHV